MAATGVDSWTAAEAQISWRRRRTSVTGVAAAELLLWLAFMSKGAGAQQACVGLRTLGLAHTVRYLASDECEMSTLTHHTSLSHALSILRYHAHTPIRCSSLRPLPPAPPPPLPPRPARRRPTWLPAPWAPAPPRAWPTTATLARAGQPQAPPRAAPAHRRAQRSHSTRLQNHHSGATRQRGRRRRQGRMPRVCHGATRRGERQGALASDVQGRLGPCSPRPKETPSRCKQSRRNSPHPRQAAAPYVNTSRHAHLEPRAEAREPAAQPGLGLGHPLLGQRPRALARRHHNVVHRLALRVGPGGRHTAPAHEPVGHLPATSGPQAASTLRPVCISGLRSPQDGRRERWWCAEPWWRAEAGDAVGNHLGRGALGLTRQLSTLRRQSLVLSSSSSSRGMRSSICPISAAYCAA